MSAWVMNKSGLSAILSSQSRSGLDNLSVTSVKSMGNIPPAAFSALWSDQPRYTWVNVCTYQVARNSILSGDVTEAMVTFSKISFLFGSLQLPQSSVDKA